VENNDDKRTCVRVMLLEWRPLPKTTELFRQEVPELRGLPII